MVTLELGCVQYVKDCEGFSDYFTFVVKQTLLYKAILGEWLYKLDIKILLRVPCLNLLYYK